MTRSKVGFASALAVLVLALGAAPLELRQRVIGIGGVDHFGTLWMWEQARLALLGDPQRLVHNTSLYFPFGMNLAQNTGGNVLDGMLASPLSALGFPLGHNLALLAVLLANGIAAGWTIPTPRSQPEVPWLAGIAAAFGPFALYELVEGRPTQALLAPCFFAVRAIFRLERQPALSFVPAAAAWIWITGIFYWYYALFLAIFSAGLCLIWSLHARSRPAAIRLVAALAAAAILALPMVGPQLLSTVTQSTPGLRSLDPNALLLHSFQPFLGMVVAQVGHELVGTQRAVPVALLLSIIFALWSTKTRSARAILLVTGILLATGPYLYVAGRTLPSPFYQLLTTILPPLDRLWHPSRAVILLVVLGAYGVAAAPRWIRAGLVALTIAASVRNGLLPLPTWSAKPAAIDLCLAQGERKGAVIDLPFAASQRTLWSQVVHGRPIAGGMHEGAPQFQPIESVKLRANNSFYAALLSGHPGQTESTDADLATYKQELGEFGFAYVILRLDELPTETTPQATRRRREQARLTTLLGPPLWEDKRSLMWAPWDHPLPCSTGSFPADTQPAEPVADRWVRELGRWSW